MNAASHRYATTSVNQQWSFAINIADQLYDSQLREREKKRADALVESLKAYPPTERQQAIADALVEIAEQERRRELMSEVESCRPTTLLGCSETNDERPPLPAWVTEDAANRTTVINWPDN